MKAVFKRSINKLFKNEAFKSFTYYFGSTFVLWTLTSVPIGLLVTRKLELIPVLALLLSLVCALIKRIEEKPFMFCFRCYFPAFFVASYWLNILFYWKFPILKFTSVLALALAVIYALAMTIFNRQGGAARSL
jgi:hypothetical protein